MPKKQTSECRHHRRPEGEERAAQGRTHHAQDRGVEREQTRSAAAARPRRRRCRTMSKPPSSASIRPRPATAPDTCCNPATRAWRSNGCSRRSRLPESTKAKSRGVYDQPTAEAVKAYQKKNGVDADGVAGAETQMKLGLYLLHSPLLIMVGRGIRVIVHTSFDILAWISAALVGWLVSRMGWLGSRTRSPLRDPGYFVALGLGAIAGALIFGSLNMGLAGHWALGHSIAGAIAGGVIAVEAFKLFYGIRGSTGAQFVAPLATGIAVGRLGCFFAGLPDYTYGTPTSLPWGVDFGDGVRVIRSNFTNPLPWPRFWPCICAKSRAGRSCFAQIASIFSSRGTRASGSRGNSSSPIRPFRTLQYLPHRLCNSSHL